MGAEDEFDIVVIGGGPGGYATALYGAAAGLSVAIVERDKVGGTCLHRGCVPAKEFLETAAVLPHRRRPQRVRCRRAGVSRRLRGEPGPQEQRGRQAVQGPVRAAEGAQGHDPVGHRARCVPGRRVRGRSTARTPGEVVIGRNVVLAAGSVPRTLPGLRGRRPLGHDAPTSSSTSRSSRRRWPSSAAAPSGASSPPCCRTSAPRSPSSRPSTSILTGCDDDIVRLVARSFKKRGIEVVTGVQVEGTRPADGRRASPTLRGGGRSPATSRRSWSRSAGGRAPRVWWPKGSASTSTSGASWWPTSTSAPHEPGVWAVGDVVAGTPQLAHVGFAEAIVAVKCMLGEPVVPVDYGKVPWAIYCHPEVAFCGLTEAQAKAAGHRRRHQEGPLRRQQPGPDHRRHRGRGEGRRRAAAPTGRPGGSSGCTWPGRG